MMRQNVDIEVLRRSELERKETVVKERIVDIETIEALSSW